MNLCQWSKNNTIISFYKIKNSILSSLWLVQAKKHNFLSRFRFHLIKELKNSNKNVQKRWEKNHLIKFIV